MRLMEGLSLRVKDIEFDRGAIVKVAAGGAASPLDRLLSAPPLVREPEAQYMSPGFLPTHSLPFCSAASMKAATSARAILPMP